LSKKKIKERYNMNNIEIYGVLNEDREIVFISDYQPVD
jgi:hypothetical protein